MRGFQVSALVLLGSLFVWWGMIPGFTRLDSDFPNYYTASRILIEGKDISRLYDDHWFQEQIYEYGIEQRGKFSPFPPLTAFVMLPVATFSPLTALQAWTILNLLILIANISLLSRITEKSWLWSTLLFLASGLALINNVRLGQLYLGLTLLIMLGYLAWQRSSPRASGVLFGIGAAVKYFPIIYLPLFVLRREWRILAVSSATVFLMYSVSVAFLGMELHGSFFSQVLSNHLQGAIQNPFSSHFQSFDSLLRRIFVYDPALNPQPALAWSLGYPLFKTAILLLILTAAGIGIVRIQRLFGKEGLGMQFVLITITGLLVSPATATYHFLLLVFPIGILLAQAPTGRWTIEQRLVALCFVALGFLPYRLFRAWDGDGFLTVMAYPRLGLLVAIFITILIYIRHFEKLPAQAVLKT